jgi:hypothetical protein
MLELVELPGGGKRRGLALPKTRFLALLNGMVIELARSITHQAVPGSGGDGGMSGR